MKVDLEIIVNNGNLNSHYNFKKIDPSKQKELLKDKAYEIGGSFLGRKKFVLFKKCDNSDTKKFKDMDDLNLHTNDRITSEVLYTAKTSHALTNAVKELFTSHFDMRKILFIGGAAVIGGVLYFVFSGGGI